MTTDSTTAPFSLRNVSVVVHDKRGSHRLIEGIDLEMARGEFLSIIGTSGAGKTTLLRVLAGLQEVAPGSTLLKSGQPISGPPDGTVLVFQNYQSALLPWRTAERNVALGIEHLTNRQERAAKVEQVLAMVGLADKGHLYPDQLSGGMQQRVQIARALAMDPQILLMDEPFGALDAMTKGELQDQLQRVHSATGVTVAFVTHDVDEAIYLSDRIVILDGKPGSIREVIDVHLPRPRDQIETRSSPEFLALRKHAYAVLADDHE